MSNFPEINREFAGLSDSLALQTEIETMQSTLDVITAQMGLERELAIAVHGARSNAINSSEVLTQIFGDVMRDSAYDGGQINMSNILSSAYKENVDSPELAEGITDNMAKRLRIETHPDRGGDTEVAKVIAGKLEDIELDPVYALSKAMLAQNNLSNADTQTLRDRRYRLWYMLSVARPHFVSDEAARNQAEQEINGAEWRVRTVAAYHCFKLIIGDADIWNNFLQRIARQDKPFIVDMINRLQPAILSIQERIEKGDPITLSRGNIEKIDEVLLRIWSTLHESGERASQYEPPYQNWLEILLPMLQMLDPGIKEGERYTAFKPPFQPRRNTPVSTHSYKNEIIKSDLHKLKDKYNEW